MFEEIVKFIREIFKTNDAIPLHEPRFIGNEKKYLIDCIDSTFVSYKGKYVEKFEDEIKNNTGAKFAFSTVNGTVALHIAMLLAGVKSKEEVITQPLTFVATANAIRYLNANPVFVDVDKNNLGLSSEKLSEFLNKNVIVKKNGYAYNKVSKKRIAACVPMHTFGFPCNIVEIVDICKKYNIPVVEDAAESLGSKFENQHTGTFGLLGIFSFNGNKTITCGGGGMIITNDKKLAEHGKHLVTTAKVPHKYEFIHDYVGYNFRLPNINAAVACAQMENLNKYIENKRELANIYMNFFRKTNIKFVEESPNCFSNCWLNTILLKNRKERDEFLEYTNANGIMTRPIWQLMNKLTMYKNCQIGNLDNAQWLEDRVVNLPSSVRIKH